MKLHAIVTLALVAPTLAGCLSAEQVDPNTADAILEKLSQAIYDDVIVEHLPVESFDGTLIDIWVFRPDVGEADVASEKVPVIINFSPYWSNAAPPAAVGGDAFSQYLIDYYVPRGYAAALVSARGTGLSEGCFEIGGAAEVRDMDVVVDHLAGQPWSNGNVSASGKSYDGTMANALLTLSNPHVKTIVPVSPISEFYKYNYYNGVPYLVTGHAFNTYYVAMVSLAQSVDTFGLGATDDTSTYERTPTRFCEESLHVQTNQYHSLATGDYTPYWQARNYTALLPDRIDASVFYIHGLQDWNVKPDHMDPWLDALQERGATVKLWLGQWAHDYPTRDDWNVTMLRWHDHYLKGIDTGILDEPLVQVQDDAGVWRDEADWPVARAEPTVLYTNSDGALHDTPGTGDARWLDAPDSPSLGGTRIFETTFAEGARISGSPTIHALVSSTGARASLSATLYIDDKAVDQGFLDLTHRDGLQTSTPMTPGTQYAVTFAMYPQDLVIPPGGKLRLEIGHATPGPVTVTPHPTLAEISIHHGAQTHLTLPLLPLDDVTEEQRQPEDTGCWAC